MLSTVISIYSLLLAIGILLVGSGLLSTLLGLRASIEGYSATVIGVGYIIGAYLCPRLIRTIGHIRTFAVLAAIVSAVMILHGLIVDPFVWWVLRIISGICIVGLYMVVESWLNSLIKTHEKRGRIFSVYMMITLIALGAGQFLLLIYGPTELASFALGAVFFALALVPIAATRLSQPQQITKRRLILREVFKVSSLGTVGAFCSGLVTGAFWGLGALYAQKFGFANMGIALFVSMVIFGGVLLQLPIGHWSDRRDRRTVLMLVAFIAAGIAGLIYLLGVYPQWLLLSLTMIYGGFSFSIYALCVSHTNDQVEEDHVMEATRTLLLLNGAGAAVGPVLAGIMMQWLGSEALMLFFFITLAGLGLFALYRLKVAEPVPLELQEEFVMMTRTSPEVVELDPRSEMEQEAEKGSA
jgi:MFS family permease